MSKATALDILGPGVVRRTKSTDLIVKSGQQEYALSTAVEEAGDTRKPSNGDYMYDDDFLGLILVEYLATPADPSTFTNCEFIEGGDLRRKNAARAITSSTASMYLNGQRLGFVNVPDNDTDRYRIHYAPRPAELTEVEADSDTLKTTIPEEYHQCVVQTAVVEIYAAEDSPSAERARVKWNELRESLMATVGNRFRQQSQMRRTNNR